MPTDGTFLHFSHLFPSWVSVRGTSGLIKKQLTVAAAAYPDVNIADRAKALDLQVGDYLQSTAGRRPLYYSDLDWRPA